MNALEDEFGDVIRKARSGLGLEVASVAAACGLTERDVIYGGLHKATF